MSTENKNQDYLVEKSSGDETLTSEASTSSITKITLSRNEVQPEYTVSIDYMEMTNPEFNRICKFVSKTYPNSCVCWIETISNGFLLDNYNKTKTKLESSNKPVNEKELFHGTRETSARAIIQTGFSAKLNKVSAYGLGSYFATGAAYSRNFAVMSKDDMAFMFVCDVITGTCGKGVANKRIDTTKFESGVNSIKAPSMYVIPNDNAIFPKYLVAFYPKAKS